MNGNLATASTSVRAHPLWRNQDFLVLWPRPWP
jgi:hypothetical protein